MFNLYFRNNFVSIYFNRERRLGKAVWSGHLSGAEYRELVLLCLDLTDRHELLGWLGDNRKMHAIDSADLQWSLEVFVPQVVAGPLLRMATLPSEYEEHRQAVEVMLEKKDKLNQKLVLRDFDNEEEAMAWLLEIV
ncbi:hypothetical protein [Pontibacter flavimaris]|uniref:STAS/SEC14 domain-containing protein n=1 Tax=Pontibacter flavimaris TaxID=1797110 RepID=A0A1Q5PFA2_9BACT|nr:hypothetical protein [Pontibacter flavimaris]OKL40896.1 hypothetical protein A3841_13710 [Pontibacter flavimaris]